MWEAGVPEPHELLRQGDLLSDVPFAILKGEPHIDDHSESRVRFRRWPAIVVSQCCTTQQRSVAELAAVIRTGKLGPDHGMVEGLKSEWPAGAGKVFYDGMLLEPVGNVVPVVTNGRYHHVAFKTRVTYTEDLEWLQHKRVARMTPGARRNLRMRLGAWYSRVEAQDKEALEAAGEFVGFHDQPEAAREAYRSS